MTVTTVDLEPGLIVRPVVDHPHGPDRVWHVVDRVEHGQVVMSSGRIIHADPDAVWQSAGPTPYRKDTPTMETSELIAELAARRDQASARAENARKAAVDAAPNNSDEWAANGRALDQVAAYRLIITSLEAGDDS